MIGVVGASVTAQHAEGYTRVSTVGQLWPITRAQGDYSGGSLRAWSEMESGYWAAFEMNLSLYGASSIWWHLCVMPHETSDSIQTQQQQVRKVVAEIRRLVSGPIVCSPVGWYLPFTDYSQTANSRSQAVAEWAYKQGLVDTLGPYTGPLSPEHYMGPEDPHLTESGIALVGRQMAAFFDD